MQNETTTKTEESTDDQDPTRSPALFCLGCVTHTELRDARMALGLTRVGMAAVTETDPTTVKRWETDPALKSARPAPARTVRLIQAYLRGWRPADWPTEETNP